jgi:hypothetical protein
LILLNGEVETSRIGLVPPIPKDSKLAYFFQIFPR